MSCQTVSSARAAQKKRSETKCICKFSLFHFTKGVSLRNTAQELLDCLHAVSSVLGSGVSSIHSNCE